MIRRTEKRARSYQNSLGNVLRVADAVEEHSPAGTAGRSTNKDPKVCLRIVPRLEHGAFVHGCLQVEWTLHGWSEKERIVRVFE
jgi:hypothetical protein